MSAYFGTALVISKNRRKKKTTTAFSDQFKKIIMRYKRIGCNVDVIVNHITANNFAVRRCVGVKTTP